MENPYNLEFYTNENMNTFWQFVEMLLKTAAPGVLIWFALIGVGLLLRIIVKSFKDGNKNNDDDDDIEIKRY
ncbi:hypothetical protein [Bacillus sp. B15-48]|uniref:hypothetical protein n=1 Tax=Bacillus sp. B15-48 TaxID=1548601 RepID=UPI0019400682|nr:hypothetical protein [Bacillus sp. B15-48]MBM4765449.1 hypothetical protein [Bacillus sp. B15-48]